MNQLKEFIAPIFEEIVRKVIKEEIPAYLESVETDTEPHQDSQTYYSKKEAAQYLRCSISSIDNYVRRGVLQRLRIGGKALFKKEDLDQLVLKDRYK